MHVPFLPASSLPNLKEFPDEGYSRNYGVPESSLEFFDELGPSAPTAADIGGVDSVAGAVDGEDGDESDSEALRKVTSDQAAEDLAWRPAAPPILRPEIGLNAASTLFALWGLSRARMTRATRRY